MIFPRIQPIVDEIEIAKGVTLGDKATRWQQRHPQNVAPSLQLFFAKVAQSEEIKDVVLHHLLAIAPHTIALSECSLAENILLCPLGSIENLVLFIGTKRSEEGEIDLHAARFERANMRPKGFDIARIGVVLVARNAKNNLL